MTGRQEIAFDIRKRGMAEVELGQLAIPSASSDDLEKYGKRIVEDHTKVNDELKAAIRS
jgi:predicted outer membrane protein